MFLKKCAYKNKKKKQEKRRRPVKRKRAGTLNMFLFLLDLNCILETRVEPFLEKASGFETKGKRCVFGNTQYLKLYQIAKMFL